MVERAGNQSVLSWFLQRISGLFLAFFLITHLNVHHLFHDITTEGIIDFSSVQTNLASSVWWQVYYFLFVPLIAFHAMNGLWAILADYRPSGGLAIVFKALFWVVGFVLTAVGALTLINLFGGGQ
jgi:succinate dehydrogenase hydrophobic anchor subunit